MPIKENLTNEQLNEKFENPFALVNYAISLAKIQLQSGEALETNPAVDVLESILHGKDALPSRDDTEEEFDQEEEVILS